MPMKLTCPHCKKGMIADERLAGKRVRCKACQQILTVPQPSSAKPPSTTPSTDGARPAKAPPKAPPPVPRAAVPPSPPQAPLPPPPADVEAEAAALFSDEPKPTAPVEVKEVELNCPYCDEPIRFPADLAGKRAPCPECKHIIKVPELEKTQPKDWRKVEARGPAGARPPDQPAPEGAWGSTTVRAVGRQTLEEVGVIAKQERPRTTWQKVRWPVLGGAAVVAVLVSGWLGYRWWAQRAADRAVNEAVAFAGTPEAGPGPAAALFQGAGEYHLLAQTPGCAKDAADLFGRAFNTTRSAPEGAERDALFADLALAQVELGGGEAEANKELRLSWDEAQKRILASLREIQDAEARRQALRAVLRRLIARGQASRVFALTGQLYGEANADRAAALSVAGMELFQADDRAAAERAAGEALALYEAKEKPPLRAEVVALALALNKPAPKAGESAEDKAEEHIGKAEAAARQDRADAARKEAADESFDEAVRFRALLAVAAAAVDRKAADAGNDVEAAVRLAEARLGNRPELSWPLLRLTELAVRADLPEERAQAVAERVVGPALRGRARLAVFRARLAKSKQAVEESEAEKIDPKSLARGLAAEALARHNTRLGAGGADKVQGWPQPLRAFGLLGVALGMRDRGK